MTTKAIRDILILLASVCSVAANIIATTVVSATLAPTVVVSIASPMTNYPSNNKAVGGNV